MLDMRVFLRLRIDVEQFHDASSRVAMERTVAARKEGRAKCCCTDTIPSSGRSARGRLDPVSIEPQSCVGMIVACRTWTTGLRKEGFALPSGSEMGLRLGSG